MKKNRDYDPKNWGNLLPEPEENTPGKTEDNGYGNLIVMRDILQQKKEVSGLLMQAKKDLEAISSKSQKQIDDLNVIMPSLRKITERFDEMGGYVDEMLEESKQYKDKGLILAPKTEEEIKEILENFKIQLQDVFNNGLAEHSYAMQEVAEHHGQIISNLKERYEEELGKLTVQYENLDSCFSHIQDKVVLSHAAAWAFIGFYTFILLFGGWGFFQFIKVPENNKALDFLGLVLIFQCIFQAVLRFGNNRKEETAVKLQKGKLLNLSIKQCLYWFAIAIVLVIYGTWALVGKGEAQFLIYLLPVASASNFVVIILERIFHRD